MFWLSFGIALATTILAYPIVNILFGPAYLGAVTTLQIYTWAGLSVSLGVAVSQYLTASNFTKISFYTTLVGAVINIILNIILLPKIGIVGGAISTLISYTVAVFSIIFFRETRGQTLLIFKSILIFKKNEKNN